MTTSSPARATKLVGEALEHAEQFFGDVEIACDELANSAKSRSFGGGEEVLQRKRNWGELRIRRPELTTDKLSLPIQRLRESLSELIKLTDDKQTAEELLDANHRLGDLHDGVVTFLSQLAEKHVYWVERSGKLQQNI